MSEIEFKGWVLEFDVKDAWNANLDSNPVFIRLDDYQAIVEKLVPQSYTLNAEDCERDYEEYKEIVLENSVFYRLAPQYDEHTIEQVCELVRQYSFFYPDEFYFNGVLYADDIKGHRTRLNYRPAGPVH